MERLNASVVADGPLLDAVKLARALRTGCARWHRYMIFILRPGSVLTQRLAATGSSCLLYQSGRWVGAVEFRRGGSGPPHQQIVLWCF